MPYGPSNFAYLCMVLGKYQNLTLEVQVPTNKCLITRAVEASQYWMRHTFVSLSWSIFD